RGTAHGGPVPDRRRVHPGGDRAGGGDRAPGRFPVGGRVSRGGAGVSGAAGGEETGHQGGFPWEVGFHAVALAMLGRLDAAGTAATEVTRRAEADPSIEPDTAPALLALGLVALARDRPDDALVPPRRPCPA